MKVLLFSCCESTSVDTQTNRLSMFHLIDGFVSATFPIVLPPLVLVIWVEREGDEGNNLTLTARLKLAGQIASEFPLELQFQNKLRARTIAELGGLVAGEPSTLSIDLLNKKKVVSRWEMQISAIGTKLPRAAPETSITANPTKRKREKVQSPMPKK